MADFDGERPRARKIPVPEWQRQELERRRALLQDSPQSGLSWKEVQERVRERSQQ